MHSKTLILDCALGFVGSCNPSWNGVNRNTEDIVRTTEVAPVLELVMTFLQRWDISTPLDQAYLQHLAQCKHRKVKPKVKAEVLQSTLCSQVEIN